MIRKSELVQEICLSDFGGAELFIGDINSDSRQEFIWLQSAGMLQSKLYQEKAWNTEEERKTFCLTATDSEGHIIWQIGKPHKGLLPYCSHGGERMVAIADIDGDNTTEVIYVRGQDLVAVDGCNGKIKYQTLLPTDNLVVLCLGKINKTPPGWVIMVKASDIGYPPYTYGNPVIFYDGHLEPLWPMTSYLGAGHMALAMDINRDGLEDFFIGYNLIDAKGNLKWTLDFWKGKTIDPVEDHVDWIDIGDINNDGQIEIAYAGSSNFFLSDREGHLLFLKEMPHPQVCLIGKFKSSIKERQIIVFNKRDKTFLLNQRGEVIWAKTLEENWPMGKPSVCQGLKFHLAQPGILLTRGLFREENSLLYAEGGWPYVIDGEGEKCLFFPPTKNIIQPEAKIRNHRPDDYGFGYRCLVANLDNKGEEQVIIYDRRYAWVYTIVGENE